MSDEARAEAERRYRLDEESRERSLSLADLNERVEAGNGFIEGAEWQASRKVEVTDAMAERVLNHRWHVPSGRCSCGAEFAVEREFNKHVLTAALNGGTDE